MLFRQNYCNRNLLVLDLSAKVIWFYPDGLLLNFLEGNVPVGIILDYIEEHPEVIWLDDRLWCKIDLIRKAFTNLSATCEDRKLRANNLYE
jgi:hypothetical protein